MAKAIDPKAQAKKQKKRAIIAGVVFLALLAYQVPKTMKMLNAKPPTASAATAPAPVSTPAPTAAPGAVPIPGAPAPAAGGATVDSLVVNADLSPVPLNGQLATMTQFSSKDPFKQQAGATEPSTPAPSATPPKTPKPSATPSAAPGGSFTAPGATPAGSTPVAPAPAPTLATISINNVGMAVTLKTDFPAAAPLFTLRSLTAMAAKISIAGGSLATGSTVTLPIGKPVTLMNTADGTRYVLVYIGPGDKTTPVATTPATGTGSTTTTPTPVAGTPTPAGR